MRTLITIAIGLFAVGCGKSEALEDAEVGAEKAQQNLDDFNEGAEKLNK